MGIVQLIITIAGFIGLFFYQHYKIKALKDQTTAQNEILNNLKIYFDIFKPDILKYRAEQHEKLIEKEKSFEIKQIQDKLSKEMETKIKMYVDAQKKVEKALLSVMVAFSNALYGLLHDARKTIINRIQDNSVKEFFQDRLTIYEEYDNQQKTLLDYYLESHIDESPKQNEK